MWVYDICMLSPLQYILIYLATLPVYFALDMLWIMVVAKSFYKTQFGTLLASSPNVFAGGAFYLSFLIGLLIFAVVPAIVSRDITHALLYGALFGFFAYMTYDLTNWATLREWSATLSVVDIAWGTFVSGVVAVASYWIAVTFIIR